MLPETYLNTVNAIRTYYRTQEDDQTTRSNAQVHSYRESSDKNQKRVTEVTAWRIGRKPGVNKLYDLNKIRWFVDREIARELRRREAG